MAPTLAQFLRDFNTERKCLEYVASRRWPDGITCRKCGKVTKHYLVEKRRTYSCGICGAHTYVTAGTAFHRSRTSLITWLYVIFQMGHTRTGIAAKQVERETGVTYKTAWRMCQLIRASLAEGGEAAVFGTATPVEMDESYIGGKPRYKGQSRPGRGTRKQPVFGMVERDGDGKVHRVRAFVVGDTKKATLLPLIKANVADGGEVYTDEYAPYRRLAKEGYRHAFVRHHVKEYARYEVNRETGEVRCVHVNGGEGYWSTLRGQVIAVHKGVAPKYLQRYADEVSFRFSRKAHEAPLFDAILSRAVASRRDPRCAEIPPR
jgi:transposase-like protein